MRALGILGGLNLLLSALLLIPASVAFLHHEDPIPFLLPSAVTLLTGGGMYLLGRSRGGEISQRDAFLIVSLAWIDASFFGSLPFFLSGLSLLDSLFETVSGFTTTGATVLSQIEQWPRGLLFWRAMTQWLGGMGIIVFSIAILPFLGVGGMQLFKAEVPGPIVEKLRPRIAQTAKLLWTLYFVLSASEALLLILGGMTPYEALCHTFTTMSTGGFSTRTASIGHFGHYHRLVIIGFMVLAGANFSLHWRFLQERRAHLKDPEFRLYLSLILISVGVITSDLLMNLGGGILRVEEAAFQAISILTTTGYSTADFGSWPPLSQIVLFSLMFLGGCAGSTAGGIKVIRVLMIWRFVAQELKKLLWPKAVTAVKVGGRAVSVEVVHGILAMTVLYMGIFILSSMAMGTLGLDMVTALSAVAACLGNVGPGLGKVGPALNYGSLPGVAKGVLMFCMLAGRLEIYTLVILFYPSFWKK